MKQFFNNYEICMTTEDSFVEGETIRVKLFRCLKNREKGVGLQRRVRFSKEAGDLYIMVDGKKYFCSEFEVQGKEK